MSESIRVGIAALIANPLRATLSTLGVVFGVAALVSVLALGDGLERFGRSQILGATDVQTLVVAPQPVEFVDGQAVPRTDVPHFTPADADSLSASLGPWARVVLLARTAAIVTMTGSPVRHGAAVAATVPAALPLFRLSLASGRFLSEQDVRTHANVVVLSAALARALTGGAADASLLGAGVELQGIAYSVVGILTRDSTERGATAYVPVTAVPTTGSFPSIVLMVDSVEHVAPARERTASWLTARLGRWDGRVVVRSDEARLAQVRQGILIFKIAMGALTGISLLVGGIGIMNVLLASVQERTREIGIRRAAGARGRDILHQFLAEAVAITLVGSAIGAALGFAGAFGVTAFMRAQTHAPVYAAFTWGTVLVAAAASTAVGLVFGMYPALRAARLSPIDAIRHE